jgi:predicted small secreted protein
MMELKKLNIATLAVVLATSVALSACNQAGTDGQRAEQPGQPMDEQTQERAVSEQEQQVAEGPIIGDRRMENRGADQLMGLLDRQNNFKKAVIETQVHSRMQDPTETNRSMDNAFNELEATLRQAAQASMQNNQAGQEGAAALPTQLDQQLRSLRTGVAGRMEGQTPDINAARQRWNNVATAMESINRQIPNSNISPNEINEIRTMARSLSANNLQQNNLQLLNRTEQTVDKMVEAVERNTLNQIAAQSPGQAQGQATQ